VGAEVVVVVGFSLIFDLFLVNREHHLKRSIA
jgi:hypothetical protein